MLGLGLDLVHIPRMEMAFTQWGERFARRILGELEWQEFCSPGRSLAPGSFLAKRFAAKEAFLKAVGTGLRQGLSWQDVQVHNDARGRPILKCTGMAHQLMIEMGAQTCHVSITDQVEYAAAVVVIT